LTVLGEIRVIPLAGLPELEEGDDLAALLAEAAARAGGLEPGDVVVVAQKAVSKVEGRIARLDEIEPSTRAVELAGEDGDPRHVEVILRESVEVLRSRPPLVVHRIRLESDEVTDAALAVRSSLMRSAPTSRRLLALLAPRSLIVRPGSAYAAGATKSGRS